MSESSHVIIKSCKFTQNQASYDKSALLYGGNEIFITVEDSKVVVCMFKSNKKGPDMKIYNIFDTENKPSKSFIGSHNSVLVSNCEFENDDEIESSELLCVCGENGVPCEIREYSL